MNRWKSSLAALVLIAGLTGSAQAQSVGSGFGNPSGAAFPGAAANLNYYSVTSGFGNYGLSGTYPGYGGYQFSSHGPVGNYTATLNRNGSRVYNNLPGLMTTIQRSTGKPAISRNGVKPAAKPTPRSR